MQKYDYEIQPHPAPFDSRSNSLSFKDKGKGLLGVINEYPKTEVNKIKVESEDHTRKIMIDLAVRRVTRNMVVALLLKRNL